ncbi:MAG: fused response regulator/phosphatase [Kofleriaceae bacterium]
MVAATRPRHRVLVVDDEETIARSIGRILKIHDVATATTAAQGVELATSIDPELVIVDFYLPDGTGKDVIDALRAAGNRAPVLLMSGAVDLEEWTEWAFFAADDFLAKPFPAEQLRAKAERLLTNFELERTAARQHAELAVLHAANARESDAARTLLDRMTQRSSFDPSQVKVESLSAGTFGGDVVMGQHLPDGRYRWLVGDVTGHTLASALVTIPISMMFYATTKRDIPLAEVCQTMDRELGSLLPATMCFAATVCELDRVRGTLRIVNAGCPDVLVRRTRGAVDIYPSAQPAFGITRGELVDASVTEITVSPGDRIYAFTAGLIERCGSKDGNVRVRQLVAAARPEQAFAALSAAWRECAPGQALSDDLSIIEVIV